MSDKIVKIYLYLLIGSSVVTFLLYVVISLVERYRSRQFLVKAKYMWRNLFFLISGLFGWYLFAWGVLNNSLVLISTFVMVVVGTIAAELIERAQSKGAKC